MSSVTSSTGTADHSILEGLENPSIMVLKAKRELVVYLGHKPVRTYRIALGFNPTGTKIEEGDGRTPEGEYYVCSKNPKSNYHLSLGLSYPNEVDAERGLKAGLITKEQYDEIASAIRRSERPSWYTKLGGEIFIHGGGGSTDWTQGCVAMHNEDIEELYPVIPGGTPVTIRP
jgi:murein L,D-transpeptidase YafK